jgi:radical SAM protein with 4Fe4S-binding SPASM domain
MGDYTLWKNSKFRKFISPTLIKKNYLTSLLLLSGMFKSLIKPVNLLKVGYSYLSSSVTGRTDISGMPPSISTELTNNCNLHCPHCSSGSGLMERARGFMDVELFKKIMKELGPYLYTMNLYFQGEPMMHPSFFPILEHCTAPNIVVSTNGHFLKGENAEKVVKSRLNKLIISLDGLDQETYSAYRKNGSLNSVIEGLSNVTAAKKRNGSKLKIEIQFLVNRVNEHQIPLVKELAGSFHATLRLKSMQIIHSSEIASWMPAQKKFRRYKLSDGRYVIKSSLPDRCDRLWFNPVITWDGKVVPCCFDKNAEYVMGDLNNDSFRDIWNGPKYRIFRKSILTGRYMIDMCRNCTSGLRGVEY